LNTFYADNYIIKEGYFGNDEQTCGCFNSFERLNSKLINYQFSFCTVFDSFCSIILYPITNNSFYQDCGIYEYSNGKVVKIYEAENSKIIAAYNTTEGYLIHTKDNKTETLYDWNKFTNTLTALDFTKGIFSMNYIFSYEDSNKYVVRRRVGYAKYEVIGSLSFLNLDDPYVQCQLDRSTLHIICSDLVRFIYTYEIKSK